MQPTRFDGNTFVPWIDGDLDDILCERFERIAGCDNCVSFTGMKLQNPGRPLSLPHVKAEVSVLRRINGHLAVLRGARKLAEYDSTGQLLIPEIKTVA